MSAGEGSGKSPQPDRQPQRNDTSRTPLELVLSRVDGARRSDRGWRARCPSHQTTTATSLSIREGADGRALLYCHGGCSAASVLEKIGLHPRDLFPRDTFTPPTATAKARQRSPAAYQPKPNHKPYTLPNGYQHVRVPTADGGKRFLWVRPGNHLGLPDGVSSQDMPLYRSEHIEELSAAAPVVLTEGEKAANALLHIGIPAVGTVTGAAGTPGDAVLEPLVRLRVYLWPDFDEAGANHMQRIGVALARLGCKDVRTITWPAAGPKADAADLVERHRRNGRVDKAAAGAEVASLIAAAQPREPKAEDILPENDAIAETRRRAVITIASTVKPEPVRWLWPGRIPLAKETLLAGDADMGKSTISVDITARVTRGLSWPDGSPTRLRAGVVMIGTEDSRSDTVRPRLDAAGADCSRVAFVSVELPDGWEDALTLPDDLPVVKEAIERVEAVLVVIDPLVAFLGLSVDSYRDHHVRRVLGPLGVLAERMGVAVLALSHPSRSRGAGNPLHFSGGSLAFVNAARAGHIVMRDPDDETRSIMAPHKLNIALKPPALSYRVVAADNGVGRIEWLGATEHTAKSLLALDAVTGGRGDQQAAVIVALHEVLRNGPVEAERARNLVMEQSGASSRTVDRAKQAAGVIAFHRGFGKDRGPWLWRLPDDRRTPPNPVDRHVSELACYEDSWRPMTHPEADDGIAATPLQKHQSAVDEVLRVFPGSRHVSSIRKETA